MCALAGAHLISLVVGVLQGTVESVSGSVGGLLQSFAGGAFFAIGIITAIFAGLERIDWGNELASEFEQDSADWDPYQLPAIEDTSRINRFELIAGIVFSAIFIVIFNFFYEIIGYVDLSADDLRIQPFFSPEFRQFIPWLTAVWAIDALVKLMVIVNGRWTRLTRGFEILAQGLSLFVLYRIFQSPAITVIQEVSGITYAIIGLVIVVTAFSLLYKVYKLFKGYPTNPAHLVKSQLI